MKMFFWFSAILVALAPFVIDMVIGKIIIILGLIGLTVQVYEKKLYNLVLLNAISITGFSYSLFVQLF